MCPTVRARIHLSHRFCSAALFAGIAATLAGCQTMQLGETTTAAPQDSLPIAAAGNTAVESRRELDVYGQQYRVEPANVEKALQYAQALRRAGQRAQAVAVLEKASMERPRDKTVLGAYGRALAEADNYDQALEVLERAHTPDQPDWHILSAQGAVLDQLGRHADAQRHYLTALKIAPDEPSILSNLGLSYALAKNLREAEATLRRAAAHTPVDPRVRQNLALVIGLQGRFAEAEGIARADLPPEEAAANAAYLRQMLARRKDLRENARSARADTGN
jgi:Flp pilus assembly protein TadD